MTALRADLIHDAVRGQRGAMEVTAVFDRTWHLRATDGWIVTVTISRYCGPLSIRLPLPTLTGMGVVPGMRAMLGLEELAVGAEHIDLQGATSWSPPECGPGWDTSLLRHDIEMLVKAARIANRGGISANSMLGTDHSGLSRLQQRARDAALALAEAWVRRDPWRTREAVGGLVGLGPGLTPSGDDLLCGFLAGTAILEARRHGSAPRVPKALACAVMEVASGTTAVGRTQLACAAGVAPPLLSEGAPVAAEPLLDVLWTLGTPGGVRGLSALIKIGHSSGSDMVTGAVLAAETVLEGRMAGEPALVDPI